MVIVIMDQVIKHVQGPPGPRGLSGTTGRDGRDGLSGASVIDIRYEHVNEKDTLKFILTNNNVIPVRIPLPKVNSISDISLKGELLEIIMTNGVKKSIPLPKIKQVIKEVIKEPVKEPVKELDIEELVKNHVKELDIKELDIEELVKKNIEKLDIKELVKEQIKDPISIKDVKCIDNLLSISLTNNTIHGPFKITGTRGPQGISGIIGKSGSDGRNGRDGTGISNIKTNDTSNELEIYTTDHKIHKI